MVSGMEMLMTTVPETKMEGRARATSLVSIGVSSRPLMAIDPITGAMPLSKRFEPEWLDPEIGEDLAREAEQDMIAARMESDA